MKMASMLLRLKNGLANGKTTAVLLAAGIGFGVSGSASGAVISGYACHSGNPTSVSLITHDQSNVSNISATTNATVVCPISPNVNLGPDATFTFNVSDNTSARQIQCAFQALNSFGDTISSTIWSSGIAFVGNTTASVSIVNTQVATNSYNVTCTIPHNGGASTSYIRGIKVE